MRPPKFIIPLALHQDISSVKQTKTGLCIKYNDDTTIDVYCDLLTGGYYESKLNYQLMYQKSTNQEILDYLMANVDTNITGYRCSYDNMNKFIITVSDLSIKCEEVNKDLRADIQVLVSHLRVMDGLKEIERFIDRCDSEPILISQENSSILKYGDQELELSSEAIDYVQTLIKDNLPRKQKQHWYRNLLLISLVLLAVLVMITAINY